jgi:hypothetical protein
VRHFENAVFPSFAKLVAQGRLLEINMNTGGFLSPPSRRGRCAVQEKWNATLDTAQRGRSDACFNRRLTSPVVPNLR